MKKSLQNGYEVVSKDDEIGYARLPRDDVSGGVWAVLNEGASKAATNYKTTIRSATQGYKTTIRSAGVYAHPFPKDQYYSPYHPNTILTSDTYDPHTLLWIKRVPEHIAASFAYTLNLLAVIGYRDNNKSLLSFSSLMMLRFSAAKYLSDRHWHTYCRLVYCRSRDVPQYTYTWQ